MVIFYVVLSLIVPICMARAGFIIRGKAADYLGGGLAYRTKSAKQTPESWQHANRVYGTMLAAIGVNLAIISVIITGAAVLAAGANGFLTVLVLAGIELVSIFVPVYVTEKLHLKLFDADGVPYVSGFDKEDEEETEEGKVSEM